MQAETIVHFEVEDVEGGVCKIARRSVKILDSLTFPLALGIRTVSLAAINRLILLCLA